MKRIILALLICMLAVISMAAQELKVLGLEETADVLSADKQRRDLNGNICAVLDVQLPVAGAGFQGNVVGDADFLINSYLVYMTPGSKMVEVKCPGHYSTRIHFADYGIDGLSSKRIYRLRLQTATSGGANDVATDNYVVISIEPPHAMVLIDGQMVANSDGVVSELLPVGKHSYSVMYTGYETDSGDFMITPDQKTKFGVKLKSNKGTLSVTSKTSGTEIYINGEKKGTNRWQGELVPGLYKIEGRMPGYRTWSNSQTLAGNSITECEIPALQLISGTVNINYKPIGATIKINGEDYGDTPILKTLPVGEYRISIESPGYIPYYGSFTIKDGGKTEVSGALVKEEPIVAEVKEEEPVVAEVKEEEPVVAEVKEEEPVVAEVKEEVKIPNPIKREEVVAEVKEEVVIPNPVKKEEEVVAPAKKEEIVASIKEEVASPAKEEVARVLTQKVDGVVSSEREVATPSRKKEEVIASSDKEDVLASSKKEETVVPAKKSTVAETPENKSESAAPANGYDNGHEWVDLGLPSGLKWATCNIGAKYPTEYGDFFAWGETNTKAEFYPLNSETYEKDIDWLRKKGYIDETDNLTITYDAARKNWGGNWRIPNSNEITELLFNTTLTWTVQNGVGGQLFTSKINGNSIFLPAAGYNGGSKAESVGSQGFYWSSTLYFTRDVFARDMRVTTNNCVADKAFRYYGQSIRPVTK